MSSFPNQGHGMFSQTAEYALRVTLYLASLAGAPATIRQIHKATLIPEGYLAKVLQSLSRAQLIRSQRGLHGGSVLAVPASELSVYEVMQAVHPFVRIAACPLGIAGHNASLCPLHKRLDGAMATVEKAFRESTIGELLAEPTGSKPLCETPDSEPGGAAAGARKK
jgi:Rrf2 family transcriptional regulator, nitric oxide-sensitive transcriptional repressor